MISLLLCQVITLSQLLSLENGTDHHTRTIRKLGMEILTVINIC